ncbi:hypothetical protein CDEST_15390 [Colletotrichum destructivum]|uniref:Uncharacterized protein n=1 Tax=Colletotrichum destructivum TaxID=34406 RepID=A0AAX4J4H9_9PEZI|nr:hypothetical protein CDEST_15390 [Colletotrichum destructivum]
MADTSSAGKYRRDKYTKNEAQDFGGSAKRQAIQLGQEANVFSAVIYYNLISKQMDGAVHVPRGQSIPNVNQLLRKLSNDMQLRVPHRHDRAAQSGRWTRTPAQNEISVKTIDKVDRSEGTTDATVFEAAVTLCRIQEKPRHVANSVTDNSKNELQDEAKFRTTQGSKSEVGFRIGLSNHDRPSSVLDPGAIKDGPVSHADNAAGKKSPPRSHGGANCSITEGQHSAQFHEESAVFDRTPIMANERRSGEVLRIAPAREPVRILVRDAANARVAPARQGSRHNRQFSQQVSKQLWFAKHHGHPNVTLNAESAPVDLAVRHNSNSGPGSTEFTKVPQRMAADGTEPRLMIRDQLPRSARFRSRGLEMPPMDALNAADIRKYRFFRLVALQLRRSRQHAK